MWFKLDHCNFLPQTELSTLSSSPNWLISTAWVEFDGGVEEQTLVQSEQCDWMKGLVRLAGTEADLLNGLFYCHGGNHLWFLAYHIRYFWGLLGNWSCTTQLIPQERGLLHNRCIIYSWPRKYFKPHI